MAAAERLGSTLDTVKSSVVQPLHAPGQTHEEEEFILQLLRKSTDSLESIMRSAR